MTKTEWEEWKDDNYDDIWALKDLAERNGNYDLLSNIVPSEEVNKMVRDQLDDYGWTGVLNFLEDIADDRNADFYALDGYGDLVPMDSWDSYADELERTLYFDEEDDEEDEDDYEEDDED